MESPVDSSYTFLKGKLHRFAMKLFTFKNYIYIYNYNYNYNVYMSIFKGRLSLIDTQFAVIRQSFRANAALVWKRYCR